MGFLVVARGRTQVLTGGHCGHAFESHAPSRDRDWWHPGLGHIGDAFRSDVYDVPGGPDIDIMSIAIRPAALPRISRSIYGFVPDRFNAPGTPIHGELLCMSLGYSNLRACGMVTAPDIVWRSETCRCLVAGAALDTIGTFTRGRCTVTRVNDGTPTLCPGDSGSPVFRSFQADPLTAERAVMTPIGIADHEYYPTRAERARWGGHDVYLALVRDVQARWGFRMWAP